jgi:hypothetical protein
LCCGFILFFFYVASFSRLSIFDLPHRYSLMFIIFVFYIFTNSKNVTKLLGWNHKYSPVDAGQWQLRQPLESIATQLISHVDASNGGHHVCHGINFASVSKIVLLDFETVPTVLYSVFFILLPWFFISFFLIQVVCL